MTAIHHCPFCRKQFEYCPSDFHGKVVCGNKGCGRPFGFLMYNISDRVMAETKRTVKEELERRMKEREAKQRRAMRSRRGLSAAEEDSAFLQGLADECPRCGDSFQAILLQQEEEEEGAREGTADEDQILRRHLMDCTSDSKHAAHAAKKSLRTQQEVPLLINLTLT